jgi:protein-tyrosine phosphatase
MGSFSSGGRVHTIAGMAIETKKILFLCTGNYYRSRFAEILFNHLAAAIRKGESGEDWEKFPYEAQSRGLDIAVGSSYNVGPLSRHTIKGLAERGIPLPEVLRMPAGAEESDFRHAYRVIALKAAEHRAPIERNFPAYADRVEYWHVHDLDKSEPEDALAQIEGGVRELVAGLGGN